MASTVTSDHGVRGYKRGCRCDKCRAANTARHLELRRKRKEKLAEADITHGASGYINWQCRCETCTDGWRLASRSREIRYKAKAQAETLEKASRYGYPWTGPELELAARTDLSARQIALMIGRTHNSVESMRQALRHEPKFINLAGLAEPFDGQAG